MPKKFIRRHLPAPEKIANMRGIGFLRHRLQDPSLWHLNRRSASGAVFWGLWCAFLPMPLHSIPAIAAAIFFRCNLPLCLLLVWINNPITLIPILYLSFFVGVSLLPSDSMVAAPSVSDIQRIMTDLFDTQHGIQNVHLAAYIEPILLGMLVLGFSLACVGYITMNYYWHYKVMKKWRKRHQKIAP